MDLEKAYDTIDRHGMWQMLRVYGVGGKLLKAVQCFYVDSRACVRVGNDVSEWFPVNVGLRLSPVGLSPVLIQHLPETIHSHHFPPGHTLIKIIPIYFFLSCC